MTCLFFLIRYEVREDISRTLSSFKYIDFNKTIKKTEVNLITSVFNSRVANATIYLLI